MGGDPAAQQRRVAAALITLAATLAHGDPLVTEPAVAPRASFGGKPDDVAFAAVLAEVRAVGVLTAARLATWPDRRLGVEPGRPRLVSARGGVLVDLLAVPVSFVARIDLGEPSRPAFDDRPGAIVSAVVDDLYVRWRPARALRVLLGRARVPFTRPRQIEEIDLPLGMPPFVVDRVAPDRRTGLTLDGESAAFSYAAGGYLDLDDLEPRGRAEDPSLGGAAAFTASAMWSGGAPSIGAGTLLRARRDGSLRLDAALSFGLSWPILAALVEGIVSNEGEETHLGGHAEVVCTPVARLRLSLRGEHDGGAPLGGVWAAAAGVGWHVTRDRRNRVEVVGWLRRDRERGTPFDALMVYLQASL